MSLVPYEFLVRWNHQTGAYQGAHVKVFDNVTMVEGDAQSVAVGAASGFPLDIIVGSIEQGAMIAADSAMAALASEKSAHEKTKMNACAEIMRLQGIIDALRPK